MTVEKKQSQDGDTPLEVSAGKEEKKPNRRTEMVPVEINGSHTIKIGNGVFISSIGFLEAGMYPEEKNPILLLNFGFNPPSKKVYSEAYSQAEKSTLDFNPRVRRMAIIPYITGEPREVIIDPFTKIIVRNAKDDLVNGSLNTTGDYVVLDCVRSTQWENGIPKKDVTKTERFYFKVEVRNGYYTLLRVMPKAVESVAEKAKRLVQSDLNDQKREDELYKQLYSFEKIIKKTELGKYGISYEVEYQYENVEEIISASDEDAPIKKVVLKPKLDKYGEPCVVIRFSQDIPPRIKGEYMEVATFYGSDPKLIIFEDGKTRAYVTSVWDSNSGVNGSREIEILFQHDSHWNNGIPTNNVAQDRVRFKIPRLRRSESN